jgi:hypothetical protein
VPLENINFERLMLLLIAKKHMRLDHHSQAHNYHAYESETDQFVLTLHYCQSHHPLPLPFLMIYLDQE